MTIIYQNKNSFLEQLIISFHKLITAEKTGSKYRDFTRKSRDTKSYNPNLAWKTNKISVNTSLSQGALTLLVSVDCVDPLCSRHGVCVSGGCICRKGWRGETCAVVDDEERRCLPDCSGHGSWDMESGKCQCHQGYRGESCSIGKFSPAELKKSS